MYRNRKLRTPRRCQSGAASRLSVPVVEQDRNSAAILPSFILKGAVEKSHPSAHAQSQCAPKRRRLSAAERLRGMHDALATAYGPQKWWPAQTPFEVILGAYLTQNTSWSAVERSLANLRGAGALTLRGLRRLPLDKLRGLIRPSGFFTRKAPALKAFVAMADEEFGGSLDRLAAAPTAALRKRLLALPGVGPETADAILLYAFGHPVPVADEYLRRIAERHGLLEPPAVRGPAAYAALTGLTRQAFALDSGSARAQLFNEFHALTVAVGKAHCGRTPRCENCPLAGDLQRFQSCYTPEPSPPSGFFLKKKPPRTTFEYGHMNSGTALKLAQSRISSLAPPASRAKVKNPAQPPPSDPPLSAEKRRPGRRRLE